MSEIAHHNHGAIRVGRAVLRHELVCYQSGFAVYRQRLYKGIGNSFSSKNQKISRFDRQAHLAQAHLSRANQPRYQLDAMITRIGRRAAPEENSVDVADTEPTNCIKTDIEHGCGERYACPGFERFLGASEQLRQALVRVLLEGLRGAFGSLNGCGVFAHPVDERAYDAARRRLQNRDFRFALG